MVEFGLAIVSFCVVDGFDHLGQIQVDDIRGDPHHWAIFLVELMENHLRLSLRDMVHPPEVGPSYDCEVIDGNRG